MGRSSLAEHANYWTRLFFARIFTLVADRFSGDWSRGPKMGQRKLGVNSLTATDAIPQRGDPVWRSMRRTLTRLGGVWNLPELQLEVEVVFSPKLKRKLGRAIPSRGIVTLHVALARAPRRLLREVLSHEAAHIAVFRRHGKGRRPHGPEWAELVREAGYRPSKSLPVPASENSNRQVNSQANTRRYEHLCPVCQIVRVAKRPMPRWRCQGCADAGLQGILRIRLLEP